MKERPILMTTDNAQKVFEGTKTQTRRIVKLPSLLWDYPQMNGHGVAVFLDSARANPYDNALDVACPYGQLGDRLWIREPFCVGRPAIQSGCGIIPYYGKIKGAHDSLICKTVYRGEWGESDPPKWRPSLHMNRRFSRTVVELTDVRVERLQDITEEDAIEEGVRCLGGVNGTYDRDDFSGCWTNYSSTETAAYWNSPVDSFHSLWGSINGKCSWAMNPWVWVLTMRRVAE